MVNIYGGFKCTKNQLKKAVTVFYFYMPGRVDLYCTNFNLNGSVLIAEQS